MQRWFKLAPSTCIPWGIQNTNLCDAISHGFHSIYIFVTQDWNQLFLTARKVRPFKIISTTKENFFSNLLLERNITNRKVSVDKGKIVAKNGMVNVS